MRYGIGIRWWLAAAFALIAAITAFAVGEVLSERSEAAFRERAQELAAGSAFEAVIEIRERAGDRGGSDRRGRLPELQRAVTATAASRRLALFVFDAQGNLLTRSQSRNVRLNSIPGHEDALASALAGERYVETNEAIGATVVAVPLRGPDSTALIAYAAHPDLGAGIKIVNREIVRAAAWAIAIGALTGVFVAALIAARLRRIASAANAIEQGRFETALTPWFRDEVGELAETLNRMRIRLQESLERLRTDRDRLERLLERLQDGVVTVDRSLRIDYANAAASRLVGRDLKPGLPFPEPWPGYSVHALAEGLFAPHGAAVEMEIATGDDRTYVVAGLPAAGAADTAVLVLTDVSERERRERAEREFVANAAHELRTPLTTITGAVEALQGGAKDDPAARERFLGHIERESARLARLVRALLVLARAQTGEEMPRLQPVEVAPLLEQIRSDLEPRGDVQIEVSCAPGVAALAEPELVTQALANLAANAVRHTAEGSIRLSGRRTNGRVSIEVSDTGVGIRRRDRERIFDRFYRGRARSDDGFGLGLAIVREVARALGGDVSVDSTRGEGTTVRIELPAAEARTG